MDQIKKRLHFTGHVSVKVSQHTIQTAPGRGRAICSDVGPAGPPPHCSLCTCSCDARSWVLTSPAPVSARAVRILPLVCAARISIPTRVATICSCRRASSPSHPFDPLSSEGSPRTPALFASSKAWVLAASIAAAATDAPALAFAATSATPASAVLTRTSGPSCPSVPCRRLYRLRRRCRRPYRYQRCCQQRRL